MAAIYINGEPVVQSNFPEMTLAQYNALPEAERPEFWIRIDASYDSIPGTAVTFNNDGTDIESTDVDGAIKEVDGKTKHGVVELWKNSDITSNFVGQTIDINDFDKTKYDAIVIVPAVQNNEVRLGQWNEIDLEVLNISNWVGLMEHFTVSLTTSQLYRYARTVSMSWANNVLSVHFNDAQADTINNKGSASTSQTANTFMIPIKILGLIHND